jgi:hypothetical protein
LSTGGERWQRLILSSGFQCRVVAGEPRSAGADSMQLEAHRRKGRATRRKLCHSNCNPTRIGRVRYLTDRDHAPDLNDRRVKTGRQLAPRRAEKTGASAKSAPAQIQRLLGTFDRASF